MPGRTHLAHPVTRRRTPIAITACGLTLCSRPTRATLPSPFLSPSPPAPFNFPISLHSFSHQIFSFPHLFLNRNHHSDMKQLARASRQPQVSRLITPTRYYNYPFQTRNDQECEDTISQPLVPFTNLRTWVDPFLLIILTRAEEQHHPISSPAFLPCCRSDIRHA